MNALFSRLVGALVLAVFLVFSVNSAIGQVLINGYDEGTSYTNQNNGYISNARVNSDGNLFNRGAYRESVFLIGWATRPASTITNATVDGGRLENQGLIGSAMVYRGTLVNTGEYIDSFGILPNITRPGGTITSATVREGLIDNSGWIGTATVTFDTTSAGFRPSTLNNRNTAVIDIANVSGGSIFGSTRVGAWLNNLGGATIHTANVSANGTILNYSASTIGTANVSGGVVNIQGVPTNAGGAIYNLGKIDTADISVRGIINNAGGTIGAVSLNGGSVNNTGKIDNLIYNSGNYDGQRVSVQSGSGGITQSYSGGTGGTIGMLTVAGNSANINWGNVTNLHNQPSGTVGEFTMRGGATVSNEGLIRTLNYDGGTYTRNGNGRVSTLNVNEDSGNTNWGNLTTARINHGGNLSNYLGTTITSATMNGGIVNNGGQIDNLTYNGGAYNGVYQNINGGIGTLYVNANAAGITWGTVSTAIVNSGGTLENRIGSLISTARINNGGNLFNHFGSTITTATVNSGGNLSNLSGAGITNATLDGGMLANAGNITTLNYNRGTYSGTGTISTLNVAGDSSNIDWGNRGTVNVNNGGTLQNRSGNRITTTTVNSGGNLSNLSGATITGATLSGGTISNAGTITGLTYRGGNYSGTGTIGTVTVAANSANVNWGNNVTNLNNQTAGRVGSYTLSTGKTVTNAGTINNLTYNGGTYSQSGTGSIGNLTLAGDSTGIDWGSVDNLQFADNGSGILSIVAFVDDTQISSASAGMRAASTELPNITFSGINVQDSVNFANGNIALNLLSFNADDDLIGSFFNAFGFDTGFFLDTFLGDMLGVSNVSGTEELFSFEVAFGGLDSFWIINDGDFTTDWTYNYDTGFVAYGEGSVPVVPEPATLAIIGLGLVGLGLARRRRK